MRHLQPVVWSKGVFLSPQHLQAQDQFFEDLLRFTMEALSSTSGASPLFGWKAPPSARAACRSKRLAASFPMGWSLTFLTPIRRRAHAPSMSASMKGCGGNFFLAVPQNRPAGINIALERTGLSTRFYSELQLLRDENSSGIEKPVSLARRNLHIVAEGESLEGPFVTIRSHVCCEPRLAAMHSTLSLSAR